jgi:hypothetical protein
LAVVLKNSESDTNVLQQNDISKQNAKNKFVYLSKRIYIWEHLNNLNKKIMAREIITLCGYKVGATAVNLTKPYPFPFERMMLKGGIEKVPTPNTKRWGSIIKPSYRSSGVYKTQVFETPEQINALFDPTTSGADAALAVTGAGTTQGTATLLVRFYNMITAAVATVSDGVRLPPATVGAIYVVNNQGATAAILKVYPATGEKINALAANINDSIAIGKMVSYCCLTAGIWRTVVHG